MNGNTIYTDISKRTGGSIFIGVIGPVRTGKSTFIQRFMESVVIPNIREEYKRERAVDEMPQSAAGRTIMTTEPKFIPEQAVRISIDDNSGFDVRLIDCVGYIVPSSLGYIEDNTPRMVMTPWFDDPIPFNMAAEIGTRKVITEHSTIGLVVTTDGSISDIPRLEYEEAEERVISELKEIRKPFVVLLNSVEPKSEYTQQLAADLSQKYGVSVTPVNCLELQEKEIREILSRVLFEFPMKEIRVEIPRWLCDLEKKHWLREAVYSVIRKETENISRICELQNAAEQISQCEYIKSAKVTSIELGEGKALLCIDIDHALFYRILGEKTGIEIQDESKLFACLQQFVSIKKQYDKLRDAYDEVQNTGYGIVMPDIEELHLEEPEIVQQGGKYGIRLKASAPSIHMMKTTIETEVTPIVGSEQQSQELVMYLLKEFEENPAKIWESNIFGKNLHELVNEGMHSKLYRMPIDARDKMRETIEKIINEGCSGLICIIL